METSELMKHAEEVSKLAYAPYSHFRVGAALLCEDGTIVTGCNVENRSYGLTICAERNAVAKALSEGKNRFMAIALCCPDSSVPVPPCGACRQVLTEFVDGDFPVHFRGATGHTETSTIAQLLPFDSLRDLKKHFER